MYSFYFLLAYSFISKTKNQRLILNFNIEIARVFKIQLFKNHFIKWIVFLKKLTVRYHQLLIYISKQLIFLWSKIKSHKKKSFKNKFKNLKINLLKQKTANQLNRLFLKNHQIFFKDFCSQVPFLWYPLLMKVSKWSQNGP